MFTVYKHTAPNGKIYIGITSQDVEKRWLNGRGYQHNNFFDNAIKKYGWDNFIHEILFENLTKEQANSKEIELIAQYHSNDRKYGYNMSIGGEYSRLGRKHTEETKAKISQKRKGIKMSEEHKQKQSKRLKGKAPIWCKAYNQTPEAKAKRKATIEQTGCMLGIHKGSKSAKAKAVKMFDLNGNYIQTFGAMSEAQEKTNIDYGSIVKVCRGQRKSAGGFYWQYA